MQEQFEDGEDKEEEINIDSVLNDEKSEENEKGSSVEINNCIIITGANEINTVLNSGMIQGNVIQGSSSGVAQQKGQEEKSVFFNFNDKKEIVRFIEEYRHTDEFLNMVSVAFLECVPDFLWIDINGSLIEFLDVEEGERVLSSVNGFMSLDKRLEFMHMASVPAECRTRFGKVEAKCIVYFSERIRETIEKTIWSQDYFLRKKILAWLMSIKKNEKISFTMGYQIVMALSRISVYDWSFFQMEVFETLLLEQGNQNRNYLVKILAYVLKNSPYKRLLDQEIQEWIAKRDMFLWEIAYRLYGINKEYKFHGNIKEQFKQYLRNDLKWRCLGDGVLRSRWNPKVDFYPAYFNAEFMKLVLQTLAELHQECKTYRQKELFMDYFIWLLTNDYKMEGHPFYRLMFLDALNEKEIRILAREMYWESWEIYKTQNVWIQILQKHFIELERYRKSWDYAKSFFQTVAFTGKESSYHCIWNSLSNMQYAGKTTEEIRGFLSDLLQKRRN